MALLCNNSINPTHYLSENQSILKGGENMQKYNKAIVAAVVGVVFVVLNQYGLTEQSTLKEVVEVILTALSVYTIPNRA
jgi:hypothetical protein